MSLFGKVLAVLNLLALGGFLYMASATLQVRQAWAYAALRWEIALDGMPVDREDRDSRDRPKYLNLNDALVAELTGSASHYTQEEYLDARKGELLGKLGDSATLEQMSELLLPLMQTAGEREAILSFKEKKQPEQEGKFKEGVLQVLNTRLEVFKKANDKRSGDVEQLRDEVKEKGAIEAGKALFEAHFKEIKGTKDRDAKRLAIAVTLIDLSDVPFSDAEKKKRREQGYDITAEPAYQRAVNVVGARMMSRAADEQARNVLAMATGAGNDRLKERYLFAAQHQSLINLIIKREHDLFEQLAKAKAAKEQADKMELKARQQEELVKERKQVLETERKQTDKEFDRLTQEQGKLYKVRLLLRDANRLNQTMEEKIRRLEAELKDE
jgi:hypothetical protein